MGAAGRILRSFSGRSSTIALPSYCSSFPQSQALLSARRLSSASSLLSLLGLLDSASSSTAASSFSSHVPPRLFLSTKATPSDDSDDLEEDLFPDEVDEDSEFADEWEEEVETEPKIGDGADGGGIVLQSVSWGEHALNIAREVLSQFGSDMELFAFKTTPRGYIYVRIDKLSNKYRCPSMEEIESYSQQYKKRLDEAGELGKIPDNLALEVSSPGAERLLKVPDDLYRFHDMPMDVCYVEDGESNGQEKTGVFFLDSVEVDSESCVWRLADVKENRDPQSKGRAFSRKQKDWRLKLPYAMCRRVTLYLNL